MSWARLKGASLLGVAVVVSSGCAALLGLRTESKERPFEHHQHSVAGVHCLRCHDGIQTAQDDAQLHIPSTEKCVSCHEKPHDTNECSNCHGLSFARGGVVRAKATLRFSHEKHRLTTKVDCVRCHADAASGAPILRPKMAECLTCHGHDEQFAKKDCNACHVDLETEGTMPDDHLVHGPSFSQNHAAAAARNDGMCATCHAERFCASCHTGDMMPITPDRFSFDTPKSGGLHRAGFLARHANESRNAGGLCTSCHEPESCATCHERENLKSNSGAKLTTERQLDNPHPEGWVGPRGTPNAHGPSTWRDPASCEACHGGAGEQLCVGCHRVGAPGGNPHAPNQIPNGSKSAMPCVQCHTGGR
ncbi:MAG: cytochrome c3 family protein [Polyangiaceae bacterium]